MVYAAGRRCGKPTHNLLWGGGGLGWTTDMANLAVAGEAAGPDTAGGGEDGEDVGGRVSPGPPVSRGAHFTRRACPALPGARIVVSAWCCEGGHMEVVSTPLAAREYDSDGDDPWYWRDLAGGY